MDWQEGDRGEGVRGKQCSMVFARLREGQFRARGRQFCFGAIGCFGSSVNVSTLFTKLEILEELFCGSRE